MVIQGISYLSDFEAKKLMTAAAARLEAKGYMPAGDGCLSVRVGPNAVWVTVSGADKANLTQDQMVRVDLNGKQTATNKPKLLDRDFEAHLAVYRTNKNVQAIVHSYPLCSVVLSERGFSVEPAAFTPAVKRLGRIQLVSESEPSRMADAAALCCRTDNGMILKGDGCVMWGSTPKECVDYTETLEYYCKALKCLGNKCGSGCMAAQPANAAAGADPFVIPGAVPAYGVATVASPVAGETCSGNCQSCSKKDNCSASGAIGASLPSGMTGLIRPGASLPPLPKEEPANTTAAGASGYEFKTNDPGTAANIERSKAEGRVLAVNASKYDVMSEVVRRTMSV
ncbi:MAG: class II aldolase/adducin family protein [Eubacteriales bacterium]|nr:class II aldolase/adducin family protein [Eubacteriales bacterium]